MVSLAQLLASHVLLLLSIAIVLVAIAVWIVVALARLAARFKDVLWSWIDLVGPGPLWRPRTYLVVHLALGLVLVAAVLAFMEVADNVLADRRLAVFDVAFANALGAQTSPGWREAFRVVTWLGTGWAIAPVAGVVLWALLARGHRLLAVMWVISQGGSALLNYSMKSGFGRPRPLGADPSLFRSDLSFPSGHAMGSLVLCGVGAYLLVRLVPSWRGRVVPMALLLAFPVVMGFSRLYLGVHYISDIIGGYLAGTAWIAVCVSGAEVALRRSAAAVSGRG